MKMSFNVQEEVDVYVDGRMVTEKRSHEIAWSDLKKPEMLHDMMMCFRIKDRALTIRKNGMVEFGYIRKRPHGQSEVFETDGIGSTDPVNFMEAYLRFPDARNAAECVWW